MGKDTAFILSPRSPRFLGPSPVCAMVSLIIMNRREYAEKRRAMARKSIEELIEALTGEDLQTRFLAEMCLRDATST